MKFLAYYRCSTKVQHVSHLGLDAQKFSVENYVRSVGGEIIDSIIEVETAGSKDTISIDKQISIESMLRKRPLLFKAIKKAQETGATLITKESTRLTRYSLLLDFLLNSNLKFICADAPMDTPFILRLKTGLAEEELLKISERTRNALLALKRRGFVKNNLRQHVFSKENNEKAIQRLKELAYENENNKRASSFIFLLREHSKMTFDNIAKKLNGDNFRTSRGKYFTACSVRLLWLRAKEMEQIIVNPKF